MRTDPAVIDWLVMGDSQAPKGASVAVIPRDAVVVVLPVDVVVVALPVVKEVERVIIERLKNN